MYINNWKKEDGQRNGWHTFPTISIICSICCKKNHFPGNSAVESKTADWLYEVDCGVCFALCSPLRFVLGHYFSASLTFSYEVQMGSSPKSINREAEKLSGEREGLNPFLGTACPSVFHLTRELTCTQVFQEVALMFYMLHDANNVIFCKKTWPYCF